MKRINSIKKNERRDLLRQKFGGRCAYCGDATGRDGTVDHYLAQAHGGTNVWSNLRWSCRPCNERKGAMWPLQWEAVLAAERPRRRESRYEAKVRMISEAIRRSLPPHGQAKSESTSSCARS
jgi:hypothetical protein